MEQAPSGGKKLGCFERVSHAFLAQKSLKLSKDGSRKTRTNETIAVQFVQENFENKSRLPKDSHERLHCRTTLSFVRDSLFEENATINFNKNINKYIFSKGMAATFCTGSALPKNIADHG